MVPRPSREAPSVEDANYLGRGAHAPLPHPPRVPATMSSLSALAASSLLTFFQSTSTTTSTRAWHLPSLCDGQNNSAKRRRRLDSGLPTVRQSDWGERWKRRVLPLAPGFFARTVRRSTASTAHCPAGKADELPDRASQRRATAPNDDERVRGSRSAERPRTILSANLSHEPHRLSPTEDAI